MLLRCRCREAKNLSRAQLCMAGYFIISMNFQAPLLYMEVIIHLIYMAGILCCGAGRSRSFLAGAGADILGQLRLFYLTSEKRNALKMFIFYCIPVLYNTYKYKTE